MPRSLPLEEGLHVGGADPTDLEDFGEGEWKMRQHGYSKRRTRRKVHLAWMPIPTRS